MTHPSEPEPNRHDEETKFHGWRLLGVIMAVVLVIAAISAGLDLWLIGPLDGRVT